MVLTYYFKILECCV